MDNIKKAINFIQEQGAKFIDLRFTDTLGKEHHVTIPSHFINEDFFKQGKMFDGSSIAGWKNIHESDMVLLPDPSTAVMDPFFKEATVNIRCDVYEAKTFLSYERDPRAIAKRAENYLISTEIADTAYFGPEPEFFIFDNVQWHSDMKETFYRIDSKEAAWNSGTFYPAGNSGHRPAIQGGYFPVPPVDSSQDMRSTMCLLLEKMGVKVETHHHEVATGNQNEISTLYNSLVKKADEIQILKYVVQNLAHQHGKTATFMPKPLMNDNGSGMHCHQSLFKKGINLFSGKEYAGLSETALFYIGGILHHAKALNAFTNSSTNSYKRLVPGYEAPVLLTYSAGNRSAAIRIPYLNNPKAQRIEVRFPDGATNPYLCFAAQLMAGIDGIKNKIHPGQPIDKNLYELEDSTKKSIPTVCGSLSEALENLNRDRAFLVQGGVFTHELIEAYINLKQEEVTRLMTTTHPVEFEMYYSL
ncbi:MAG: glutamate--ammonia ligase [Francisellaceae bacterium]|nr:glutamate--ammonia ligase [Francisellaceae bacterium]